MNHEFCETKELGAFLRQVLKYGWPGKLVYIQVRPPGGPWAGFYICYLRLNLQGLKGTICNLIGNKIN